MGRVAIDKLAAVRVTDRRVEIRYDGSINGCYTLSSRRRTDDNTPVQVFACRARSISPTAASVTAPVPGEVGELITARFDGLGIMRGEIDKLVDDGFVFSISASLEQRKKLGAKIDLLKRRNLVGALEKRAYRRQQPLDPRSVITLPDGGVLRCFVIDFSRSGAAISADYMPDIGARVVVGALAAKVVRYLDVGFSVQFEAVQDAEGLGALLTGYQPRLASASDQRTAATAIAG
jgi:hypothetical protein